jgi:hypothetical protein
LRVLGKVNAEGSRRSETEPTIRILTENFVGKSDERSEDDNPYKLKIYCRSQQIAVEWTIQLIIVNVFYNIDIKDVNKVL